MRGHGRLAGTSCPLPAARGAAAPRGLPTRLLVGLVFPEAVNPRWVPAPLAWQAGRVSRMSAGAQIYSEWGSGPGKPCSPRGKTQLLLASGWGRAPCCAISTSPRVQRP